MTENNYTVGIVGGGIAGSTIALRLSELGIKVVLLEKGESLVNGPPFCHLHAGGNLYREISDHQCLTLLKESIELVRFYPNAIDYRPTLIAIPLKDSANPADLLPRLHKLKAEYARLIAENPANEVLGDIENYYKLYDRAEVEYLKEQKLKNEPQDLDEWLIAAAQKLDLDTLKFPLLMVAEYGLNIFRLAATVNIALNEHPSCQLITNANVSNIKTATSQTANWEIEYEKQDQTKVVAVQYLINACGFRTGTIDDMLSIKRNRMVEFKAAYVSKWDSFEGLLPEIIFHGTRGTKDGMAQLTPYPQGYFQIHGMTPEITLFKDGLANTTENSSQPKLENHFISKIEGEWKMDDIEERTRKSIQHVAQFIPDFKRAKLGGLPLFGAQQIPGNDPALRAANVSFPKKNYACCEIVKASSTLTAANAVLQQLLQEGHISDQDYSEHYVSATENIKEESIHEMAEFLCKKRKYPIALAQRVRQQTCVTC